MSKTPAPLLCVEDPERAIVELVLAGRKLRERDVLGHSVVEGRGFGEGLRFVCDDSAPGKVVVVTVLPPDDAVEEGDSALAAAEDWAADAAQTISRLVEQESRLRQEALRASRVAGALQAAHARVLKALKELSQ